MSFIPSSRRPGEDLPFAKIRTILMQMTDPEKRLSAEKVLKSLSSAGKKITKTTATPLFI